MMNFDKDIYYLGVGAQLLNSSDTVNTAKLTITEGDKKEYVVTGSDDNVFVLDRIHNPDKNTIEISIKGLSKGGGFMMGTHLQPPSDQDAASVIVYDCKVKIKQPDNINHLHPDESAKFSIDFANTDVGYSNPTWQVDDKTIANIDAKGELTILKPGKVNVKLILSYNGIEFFDDVAVNIAVPPISFDKDEYLMGIGGHLVNKADSSTQATIDFHGVDFSHYIVESSDESVFTVKKLPDSGQLGSVALTAVGKGKAQLTVKNDKSIKTVPVEILSKHVSILDFFELHVNQLTRMKLDVFTDVGYSNPEWSIIDGDKYASIDNLGLVRPKEQGRFRAQVIVTYSGIKFSAFRDIIIAHEISSVKPIILTDLPETYNYSE
ncbi:MAG: Ig-like domain-containing protein, partial [Enterobacteriaceae bacterium]|nr:Ig-like domain-containing protein [Enterobacteriaceae bacterium]